MSSYQLIYFPPHKYKEKGALRSGVLFILSADADKAGSNDYLNNLRIQKKIVEENRTEAIRE